MILGILGEYCSKDFIKRRFCFSQKDVRAAEVKQGRNSFFHGRKNYTCSFLPGITFFHGMKNKAVFLIPVRMIFQVETWKKNMLSSISSLYFTLGLRFFFSDLDAHNPCLI